MNDPKYLAEKGPLLLAVNHPNSFLDAIILDVLFNQPVYSLARGDVFVNKWVIKILTAFKILPVYRLSEGADNLQSNYDTFDKCKDIFRSKGIVLIFSEGRCVNEWHLRPLKKGTARLAISSWEENIPLRVLPAGINYSSFTRFGKTIHINFGDIIDHSVIRKASSEGEKIQFFNQQLKATLQTLVYEIAPTDIDTKKKKFQDPISFAKNSFLLVPALLGWLIHLPLYIPVQRFTYKRTSRNDHYDSVLMALLFICYPIFLILISLLLYLITGSLWSLSVFLIFPICALAYIHIKPAV